MRRFLVLLALLTAACQSGDFDSGAWKGADLGTRERVDMAQTLIARDRLDGLNRDQVEKLLGQPTLTDKWHEWDMIYVLGPTEYMPIDHEWLVIRLGEDGKVTEYQLTAD